MVYSMIDLFCFLALSLYNITNALNGPFPGKKMKKTDDFYVHLNLKEDHSIFIHQSQNLLGTISRMCSTLCLHFRSIALIVLELFCSQNLDDFHVGLNAC